MGQIPEGRVIGAEVEPQGAKSRAHARIQDERPSIQSGQEPVGITTVDIIEPGRSGACRSSSGWSIQLFLVRLR